MNKTKFLFFNDCMVIFPSYFDHSDTFRRYINQGKKKLTSAGFVFAKVVDNNWIFQTYGKSISLGIISNVPLEERFLEKNKNFHLVSFGDFYAIVIGDISNLFLSEPDTIVKTIPILDKVENPFFTFNTDEEVDQYKYIIYGSIFDCPEFKF